MTLVDDDPDVAATDHADRSTDDRGFDGAVDAVDAAVIAASLEVPALFGSIFDRHATVLHRYLVRRLGPDEADAVLGEVFRIAFQRRHTYDVERGDARPWLYGIATNLVAKHRRTEGRRMRAIARLAAQRDDATDVAERAASRVDAERRWQLVAEAFASLPQAEVDALVLHVWEALPYAQVAEALGVPVGTVRSRLHRARGRLRELVASSGQEQGEHTGHDERAGGHDRPDTGRIGS
jgi:RNA polymerase sigma factor (sigma-70 family)